MRSNELDLLLAEGEGLMVELKEKYTPKIDRDIVALANSRGGTIILGVDDDGKVCGEKLTNRLKAEILSLARNCEPHIAIQKISQIDSVIVIEIPEGDEKPYSCSSGYFRRLDAVTQKMTHKEVGLLFKDSTTTPYEERVCKDVSWNDISKDKIKEFFKEAGIAMNKIDPQDVLVSLNLATKNGVKNAGVLFFAREPRRHIVQCETILVSFKGNNRVDILDRKDIQDDLWTQYHEIMIFLKRHLSIKTEIKGLERSDSYEIPLEALREAVANAIIHRDYNIRGTNIMVEVHDDKVIIKNPGGFPSGMTADKIGSLSVRRNELIADMFARMHRVERMGSGFKRIRESIDAAGLHFPKISSDEFFFIEFERPSRTKGGLAERLVDRFVEGLVENQRKMLSLIEENPYISKKELAHKIGISTTAIDKNIVQLKKKGLLERIGPDRGGRWKIVN